MNNNTFAKRTIPDVLIQHIFEIIDEYSAVPLRSEIKQKGTVVQNLLSRNYLESPRMRYDECLRSIQPSCPFPLEMSMIRRAAERCHLDRTVVRVQLAEWAIRTAELIYEGFAGNQASFDEAQSRIKKPFSEDSAAIHPMQGCFVLHAMFEYIPELKDSASYRNLEKLGTKYCNICLNKALDSAAFDLNSHEESKEAVSEDALRREVYLAKRELDEFREMMEKADADLEKRVEERCREEIAEFFRSLNDPRYGHIIDSVYLQYKACSELRRSGENIPYLMEGVPGLLEKMLRFFKDFDISPAIKFPPDSIQKLTVQQMEGCQFEPHPSRTAPLTEDSVVTVRVISSGWRYGSNIISCPILREEAASR